MQLFTEDIVERIDGSGLGVVARTWHEQLDYDPQTTAPEDPLLRHLHKGEIGFQSFPNGAREILPEATFRLVDRCSFVRGDYCKRAHDDHQSGVVLNLKVQFKIQHTITLQSLDQWFDKEDFQASQPLLLGDLVFYNDWVGQVEEIFNEALMVSPSSKMQPVYELGGRFAVGEKFYTPTNGGESLPSQELDDVIVKVTPVAAAISWSAINQSLEPSVAQDRQRPDQLWPIDQLHKLVVMKPRGSVIGSMGERVVFKDPLHAARLNIHNMIYKDQEMKIEVNVEAMVIRETRTQIEVLWQDGTRSWETSTDLIPHLNLDEYECWPGDFVLWKHDDERRVAVVQAVSAKDRVASVRWFGTDLIEDVSVLELDPHGLSFGEGNNALQSFGVRRGDCVLIHKEDADKVAKIPLIPRIGELESWVHEIPSRTPDGTVEGWRGDLTKLAIKTLGFDWRRSEDGGRVSIPLNLGWSDQSVNILSGAGGAPGKLVPPTLSTAHEIDWFGQVMDLTLDGNAVVCLPSNKHVVLPLSRLSLYRDIEDYHWDGMDGPDQGAADEHFDEIDSMFEDEWEAPEADDRNDWSHMELDDDSHSPLQATISIGDLADSNPQFRNNVIMPGTFPASPPSHIHNIDLISSSSTQVDNSPRRNSGTSDDEVKNLLIEPQDIPADDLNEEDLDPEIHWKRFDVLPEAPQDHAFYSYNPVHPNKIFLARLSKEYRVLQSSLPDSILVRAYEDRADLLRCMIMGPENTPYEDAPFVIDWRLDESFPQSPPIAHFLSWTNGNGRVNPNLYEEGKVCLSILGTWAGERSESWSAARSSLLQAFVSIQGLVLVKDPYFCEPSFERMRGTEEGMINSRLYSEKAYVLSRGFVRRALEHPPGGLEGEIMWFYYTKGGLSKVLNNSRKLIARSSMASADTVDADSDLAVPRLSTGGILTVTRTLKKLQELLDARDASRR